MAETANFQPMQNGFTYNPNLNQAFGGVGQGYQSRDGNPWMSGSGDSKYFGHGMYGLPEAFTGWNAASRYSFAPALQYAQDIEPAISGARDRMNKDWSKELYTQASDVYEGQARGARRLQGQQMARAGYRGGGGTSPFAAFQLQQEAAARSGSLGRAAQQAVFMNQQMQSEGARSFQNLLTSRMQALLTPAQYQSMQTATVPGTPGPSYILPAAQFGGSLLNAAS